MILITIITMAIIFLGIATAVSYFAERDEIAKIQEESGNIQGDRVKENLEVRLHNKMITVKNTESVDSVISSIMIQCDDGAIHTEDVEFPVKSAGEINQTDAQKIRILMKSMEGKC